MEIHARHDGAALPFERDRRLVLRRLPAGAVVTRAAFTLTPVSTDPGRRFLETITLPTGTGPGTWGATKVLTSGTNGAVEIDLHTRRRLASLVGSGNDLGAAPLLVDLGGGFMAVDEAGGFGDGDPYRVAGGALPGLAVTGIRLPAPDTDVNVSLLRVSSPPSNLTLAVAGGPVFFTHLGDLVEPVTTPDFADLLQALLPDLDVEHGCVVVPFVLHSDTIARVDVALDVELALALDAGPRGVATVTAAYRYDGVPQAGGGHLAVAVPAGAVVVSTTGRVQGAFAATRVVHGPVTAAAADALVTVEAGRALAQPVVTGTTEVVSAVDLLLTAVTAEARVAVDLVGDLDGKPGRASLLPRPAELTLTRDTAGTPTWLSVALPAEVEIEAGQRSWLVVQALAGTATWSAAGSTGPGPVLQHTRDGALSWRAAGEAGLAAALRLRHVTDGFRMPLELRVAGAGGEQTVSLQRFAPAGRVDLGLDFPEVAAAVNAAVSAAGGGAGPGEQVANGDFVEWFRVGTAPQRPRTVVRGAGDAASHELAVVGPDGARAFVIGRSYLDDREHVALAEVDLLAATVRRETVLCAGAPVAVAQDGAGRWLAVVTALGGESRGASSLVLVDTGSLRPVGTAVALPPGTAAAAADGRGVYLVNEPPRAGGTVLRHVGWSELTAATGGGTVDWAALPSDELPGEPVHLTTGPEGQVAVLTRTVTPDGAVLTRLFSYRDLGAVRDGYAVEGPLTAAGGAVATAWAGGQRLLVLAGETLRYLRGRDLAVIDELPLAPGGATSIATDAAGTLTALALDDVVGVLDVATGRLSTVGAVVPGEGEPTVALSPTGTHAVLTRPYAERAVIVPVGAALPAEWEVTAGTVQPVSLPATGQVLAMLGQVPPVVRPRRHVVGQAREDAAAALAPSAISQVVPVVGGARYRFAFAGFAAVEGGTAEVRWHGDGCAVDRVDRVAVSTVWSSVEAVPHHEAVLTAPAAARTAEVRFASAESAMLVDRVTLSGSSDIATGTWEPAGPGASVAAPPADVGFPAPGVVLANGGADEAAAVQHLTVPPGVPWQLTLTAVTSGTSGARVELGFADDLGAALGQPVTVPLDVLDLDAHAATGTVPAGAAEAVLAVVLPAGAEVRLAALHLAAAEPTAVDLYLASEAPGEVSLTDVAVRVDAGAPETTPVPPEGLCPPAPAGGAEDGDCCYCQSCGSTGPVGRGRPARTDAGRPAVVTPCPTCGADRLHTGGTVRRRVGAVPLPRFRAVDRSPVARTADVRLPSWIGGPAVATELRVEAAVTEVDFVGPARAAALAAAGVQDVVTLARADVTVVAALPGVSEALARRIIASAAELVRARGRRVPLGL